MYLQQLRTLSGALFTRVLILHSMNSTSAITLDNSLVNNLECLKDALVNQSSEYDLLDVIYLRGIVSSINEQLSQVEDSIR